MTLIQELKERLIVLEKDRTQHLANLNVCHGQWLECKETIAKLEKEEQERLASISNAIKSFKPAEQREREKQEFLKQFPVENSTEVTVK